MEDGASQLTEDFLHSKDLIFTLLSYKKHQMDIRIPEGALHSP